MRPFMKIAESIEGQPIARRFLLACGLMAGPLFTVGWIVGGLSRANYDPRRYPISALSIGEFGWTQIANFIVTGLLVFACAIEFRRALRRPSGSVWGPLLVGLLGIGLIGAGIFVPDPLNGYPPGTPLIPTERTTHGILHDLFGIAFFLGVPINCFVFARLFSRWRQRAWAWYSRVTGIGMLAILLVSRLSFRLLPTYPDLAANFGLLQRVMVSLGFAWLTAVTAYMLRSQSEIPTTGRN